MLWLCGFSTIAAFLAAVSTAEDSCPAGAGSRCTAAAKASGENRTAKVYVPPTADLLTQEIDELKAVLKISEQKIELLEELRRTINSGVELSLPEAHLTMLKQQLPLMSEVALDQDKAPTGSADDYVIAKAIIPQEDPARFIRFLALRNARSSSSPSHSPVSSNMPSALVVAAHAEVGGLKLFTPSGELVLSFHAGHDQPLTNLAVSLSNDDNFITTADAGGSIRVHRITVRQRRLTKEEREARKNSTSEKVSNLLGNQLNVTYQLTTQMQVPTKDGEKHAPRVTALAVASQQGAKYFVAGDEEGKINIFSRNGTFTAKLDASVTDGAKIESLQSHLSNLLFHDGYEWGFVNLEKLEVVHMDCPKFEGRVVSAIIDSQQSSRVLVSDEEGVVWVFTVKEKKNCKLEHTFPKGIVLPPLELASVRGFTVALEKADRGGDEASVLAINMSHVGKKKESLKGLGSAVVWRRGRQAVRDWAIHKRYQQGDLLAFLSEDGREIEVLELLMQVYQPPQTESFNNFKMPVIAVAVVLVLGYQYMKQKGKFSAPGGSSKLGGGGKGKIDWDSADFAKLRNMKGAMGKSKLDPGKLGGLAGKLGKDS